jgi:hypothetical protein
MKYTPKQYLEYYTFKTVNFFKNLKLPNLTRKENFFHISIIGLIVAVFASIIFMIADSVGVRDTEIHAKLISVTYVPSETTTSVDGKGNVTTTTDPEYWINVVVVLGENRKFETSGPRFVGKEGELILVKYGYGRFTGNMYVGL